MILRLRQLCDHPSLIPNSDIEQEPVLTELSTIADKDIFGASVKEELIKNTELECPLCLETMIGSILLPCLHRTCEICIEEYLTHKESKGDPGECPVCNSITIIHLTIFKGRKPCSKQEILRIEKEEINGSEVINLITMQFKMSTKLTAVMDKLKEIRNIGDEKTVIFSQWTSMLDVIEIPLNQSQFQFVRLDGTMTQKQRITTLASFGDNPSVTVLIASLKSSGVGLNLTVASRAILIDPWWNESTEMQAIDRIHR